MFKSDGAPVLIDFDSCAHVGENLVKVGGREDQYYTHAAPMNDYTALKKIEDIINSQWSDANAKSQEWKIDIYWKHMLSNVSLWIRLMHELKRFDSMVRYITSSRRICLPL